MTTNPARCKPNCRGGKPEKAKAGRWYFGNRPLLFTLIFPLTPEGHPAYSVRVRRGMDMRKDIHKPSAIQPENYEWVAFKYYGSSDLGAILAMKVERENLAAHMNQTGGKFSGHEHGGLCHVCGQGNISYASVFYHKPSNSYIITGEDCARNIESRDMSAFRRAIQSGLEAQAGKKKAAAILEAAGLTAAWKIYTADYSALPGKERKLADDQCRACGYITATTAGEVPICGDCRNAGNVAREWKDVYYEELTIRDIVGKLVKYGSASEKALGYVKTLLARIADRPALEEKKAAEQAAAADCPTGRVQITGEVVGFRKADPDDRFPSSKVLVKDDSGFKVWGNRFAGVEKGDRVTFTATVTPSKDDAKFGFFKRPKGNIIWPEGDSDLVTCPTCEGNSSACGMCGGRHKVSKGEMKRAGFDVPASAPAVQEVL